MDWPPNLPSRQSATWWRWNGRFLRQLLVGALSHLVSKPGALAAPVVQGFFRGRYSASDPSIFDCRTAGYCDPILEEIRQRRTTVVVDLGCGDGALCSCMREAGIEVPEYIGLDFAIVDRKIGERAHLLNCDVRQSVPAIVRDKSARTITLINTLCYLPRIEDVALLQLGSARTGDTCLVMEPYPGWFWDRSFAGIQPLYRPPTEVASDLASLGWHIREITIHHSRLGGLRLFPISYLIAADR